LEESGQVVLHYCPDQTESDPKSEIRNTKSFNPNGSQGDVAGICDATGRVLGLMPHPERHVLPTQHPQWTRLGLGEDGDGMRLFKNAVEFFG
jgi:phosphoribosylformylglycinamidine synthase